LATTAAPGAVAVGWPAEVWLAGVAGAVAVGGTVAQPLNKIKDAAAAAFNTKVDEKHMSQAP
jgi:hypothetical protein